jgi:hypothetical protein
VLDEVLKAWVPLLWTGVALLLLRYGGGAVIDRMRRWRRR